MPVEATNYCSEKCKTKNFKTATLKIRTLC